VSRGGPFGALSLLWSAWVGIGARRAPGCQATMAPERSAGLMRCRLSGGRWRTVPSVSALHGRQRESFGGPEAGCACWCQSLSKYATQRLGLVDWQFVHSVVAPELRSRGRASLNVWPWAAASAVERDQRSGPAADRRVDPRWSAAAQCRRWRGERRSLGTQRLWTLSI